MKTFGLSIVIALAIAVVGCEKKESAAPSGSTPTAAPSPAPTAAPAPPTAAPMANSDAQAKLDQVMQYIKDNKLDLADTTLSELESNKASLPPAVQSKLPTARASLNAAKLAAPKPPGA